jgi:hypothetical protein
MTDLADIVGDCRQRYNAVGDRFFQDEELYDLVYEAEMEMSQHCQAIETIYTATTTIAQRQYTFPSRLMKIKRITYNGERLQQTDFLEDDAITGNSEETTSTGDPKYYSIFADTIFLRPIPSAAQTLKIYAIIAPSEHTAITSSLTVPERYRPFLKDYVLSQMFAKDKNGPMVQYHEGRWQGQLRKIKAFEMKRKQGDAYKIVKDIDSIPILDTDI